MKKMLAIAIASLFLGAGLMADDASTAPATTPSDNSSMTTPTDSSSTAATDGSSTTPVTTPDASTTPAQ